MPEDEQEAAQVQAQIAINVSQQSMTIMIAQQPLHLTIDENGMNQMVTQWLATHPALFDELIKQRLAQKKTELAIIQDIRSAKLH